MEEILYYFDKPIDETLISDTFQKAYGIPLNIKSWEWRFLNNPVTEKVYINYIEINGVLAAYYAVSPVNILIDGQSHKIALSNMTMTHPDHQGKGYFKMLAKDLYKKLKEDGYIGVFGFANQNSHYGFRKNLGWIDLAGLNSFSVDKNDFRLNLLKKIEGANYTEAALNLSHIQRAKELICSKQKIVPDRSENFLSWRLLKNPSNQYHTLLVEVENDLKGILFFKFYNGSIDIMECYYTNQSELDPHLTLINAISYLIAKYNMRVNMWSNLHSSEHLTLEKYGFKESNFLTYFGVIPFVSKPGLTDLRTWHYRFIDSDVF
ncbi:MAG: GNAT family N-acetyltransferase [Bacteroidetes bacterium]|nr:GNAT family N-acetyltransferase [Bacteroidota bacterium]